MNLNLKINEKVTELDSATSPNPLISVIVTTYKHENYIEKCLDGVLMQQTNFDFEIILGEDDSPDKTREICIEYAKKYGNTVRLFLHNRANVIFINGSASGRFNFLHSLSKSKGKYIALCEGDDYWTDPLKLQKQVDFLENHPDFNLCFHNTSKWKDGQLLDIESYPPNRKQNITFIDLLKGDYVETCSGVFRVNKEILKIPTKMLTDTTLYLACLENDKKGHYINENMAVYRIHEGGIWSLTPKLNKLLAGFRINEYFLKTYTQKEHAAVVNHNLKRIAIEISFLSLKEKKLKEFLTWQKKSCSFYSAKTISIYYAMLRKYFLNKNLFKKTAN